MESTSKTTFRIFEKIKDVAMEHTPSLLPSSCEQSSLSL